jgi:hypothetical protein
MALGLAHPGSETAIMHNKSIAAALFILPPKTSNAFARYLEYCIKLIKTQIVSRLSQPLKYIELAQL